MNSVQIIGNLPRDPAIRSTKAGRAVASFTVAVSRQYTTPQGEQKEITDWINVVAWGNLAEAVGNQLRKGSRVFVEGRYTTRSYDGSDGQKRWITEVTANFIGASLEIQAQGTTYSQPQGGAYDQPPGRFNQPQGAYNQPRYDVPGVGPAVPSVGNQNQAPSPAGSFAGFGAAQPEGQGNKALFPAGAEEEIPF